MQAIHRILVTTDLSEGSEIALPWAEILGKKFGARVKLLCVIHPDIVGHYPYFGLPETLDVAVARSDARKRMERMVQERSLDHKIEIEVEADPSASRGIIKTAEKELFDLIVMSTHGRSGLGHFVLGSVVERVVQHSKVPVLAVREGADPYLTGDRIGRVLCPTDLSEHSLRGIWAGIMLARPFQAQVDILHVAAGEPGEHGGVSYMHSDEPSLWDLRDQLDALVPPSEFPGANIQHHVMRGQPTKCINQFADENNCALIALSTHGHDAISDFLLGSTTERVLRHSNQPVFIVPSHVSEYRADAPAVAATTAT